MYNIKHIHWTIYSFLLLNRTYFLIIEATYDHLNIFFKRECCISIVFRYGVIPNVYAFVNEVLINIDWHESLLFT